MKTMVCNECGHAFWYQVTEMNVPGGKDKEFIYCPYCNENNGYTITSGFVYSFKIDQNTNMDSH